METTAISADIYDEEEAVILRRYFSNTGRGLGKETMKTMMTRMAGTANYAKDIKEYESSSSYISTDVVKGK